MLTHKSGKKGCYMIIPKQNLLYSDIDENLKNKLYRLVDEVIRDKNRQIEIIDGLVPKSVLNSRYIPSDHNELIVTESQLMDPQFVSELYKTKSIKNFRVNDYGDVIDTVDFTNPKNINKISQKKLSKILSMVQVSDRVTPCEIKETGEMKKLF